MTRVSRSNPFYYLTSVAKDRLPVFRTDKIKQLAANAFDEARRSGGILIFAYVIMPDHSHIVTDGEREDSEVLRFMNGISAKRIIDHLKAGEYNTSLLKLREATKKNNYKYSLWEHHPNSFEIYGEDTLMQKVNYIHQNPVRAGLVEKAEDYLYSSARIWNRRPLENEPLLVDIDKIDWR
ncbi:MAG: transposase [Acidobacteria bacterium]|nr:transposase [Acidobacteriota bacterium]